MDVLALWMFWRYGCFGPMDVLATQTSAICHYNQVIMMITVILLAMIYLPPATGQVDIPTHSNFLIWDSVDKVMASISKNITLLAENLQTMISHMYPFRNNSWEPTWC